MNNQLIDVIYDDMNYFWNQDYKDVFTKDQPEYMADKLSIISHEQFKNDDIFQHPYQSLKIIEDNINRYYVAQSLGKFFTQRFAG